MIKTTALVAPDLGIGFGSALELNCTVTPIAESAVPRRSWNGSLLETSTPAMQQYRVTLSASGDLMPPALSDMWPGKRFVAQIPVPFGGGQTGGRRVVKSYHVDEFGVHGTTGDRFYEILEMDLQVVEPWTATVIDNRQEHSWQLVAEEYRLPGGGA